MDKTLVNPFIKATYDVLATMAATKAKPGKPYLKKKNNGTEGVVTGVIGLTGEVRGTIAVSFDKKSILEIVSAMFGEAMTELNDEIKDAVGEITNMISGQARQALDFEGRRLKTAIPTVIMAKEQSVTFFSTGKTVAIPFETKTGRFTIEVCFES